MKTTRWATLAVALAVWLAAPSPTRAETVQTTETTTTTTYSGVVTEVAPTTSKIIIRKETEQPKTYVYSNKTVFLDPAGQVVTAETVRGRPVTVYYERAGDALVVNKVIVAEPSGTVTERKEVYREVR